MDDDVIRARLGLTAFVRRDRKARISALLQLTETKRRLVQLVVEALDPRYSLRLDERSADLQSLVREVECGRRSDKVVATIFHDFEPKIQRMSLAPSIDYFLNARGEDIIVEILDGILALARHHEDWTTFYIIDLRQR